ncbi:MAG: hypothetical protein RLZZ618_3751 [Pseudomonadota bacterium]
MDLASENGIQQLALGDIAKRLNISKSGVFVRVGSLESLQLLVVDECERIFRSAVLLPTLNEPRGLPQLDSLVILWITRGRGMKALLGAHYKVGSGDDVSALALRLQSGLSSWRHWMESVVSESIQLGHVRRDTEPAQLVFEIVGVVLALLYDSRMNDPRAEAHALAAYFRLMTTYRTFVGQQLLHHREGKAVTTE